MTKIDSIKEQILLSKRKTDKLIANFPTDKWLVIPEILNTNLNWQIGHIILVNYLHGVASISGINVKFSEKINVPDYIKFYGPTSNPTEFEKDKPCLKELIEAYDLTFSLIEEEWENIEKKDLDIPPEVPNPEVQTKYEALLHLPQHQSWHNGQIALLKRVLNKQ